MSNACCIYPANSVSGLGAASVIKRVFDLSEYFDALYYSVITTDPPPDVTGKKVIIVDFCYDSTTLQSMLETAESIFVIAKELPVGVDFLFNISMEYSYRDVKTFNVWPENYKGAALIDPNQSTAVLAWNYFFQHEEFLEVLPEVINYVQDIDSGNKQLSNSAEMEAFLVTADLQSFTELSADKNFSNQFTSMVEQGATNMV